jgi:hypothetical protein
MRKNSLTLLIVAIVVLAADQQANAESEAKFILGTAGFLDEVTKFDHTVLGGAYVIKLAGRLRIGPEFLYMIGPGNDRDFTFSAQVAYALYETDKLEIYAGGGIGLMHHKDQFGIGPAFTVTGIFYDGGISSNVYLTNRIFVTPQFRIGIPEGAFLFTAGIGYKF